MEFRLELIHGTQVLNASTGKASSLRSYKGILSALGYSERPLSRSEIISAVWPDAATSVGRNRLRVALVKLRGLMPGAIIESESGLTFDQSLVQNEANEIRLALERTQDSVTTAIEYEALASALKPLGDGSTFDREAPGASDFAEHAARYLLRLSELAVELSRFDEAVAAAKAATHFDPESSEIWESYLLAQWRRGTADSALDDAKRRAPRHIQGDAKFRAVVKQVRSKYPGAKDQISSDRRALWLEILESLEATRPDLMRAILSSPQTLALSGRHPRSMHDLLQGATPLDIEDRDTTWERSAARMIGLKAWLGDAEGVLAAAPAVLGTSTDAQIQRAVWNAVAVGHSLNRDWKQAYEALEMTLEFARQCGSEMYELTTRGNGAFFKMQEGRFEESRRDYDAILERFVANDTPQAKFENAIAVGNRALISVFEGDWETALVELEQAMAIRASDGLQVQMGILHASMALVGANLNRLENVVKSMRLAFLDAFESESSRSQQFTFEIAAATISVLGDIAFAQELRDWTGSWRRDSRAPRSEAERMLVSRIPGSGGTSTLSGEPAPIGMEAMKRLRVLIAQRRLA